MPCSAASPERGRTRPATPGGSAIATPVATTARSPGASATPSAQRRSRPASPGRVRCGGCAPSRRTVTCSSSIAGAVTMAATLAGGSDAAAVLVAVAHGEARVALGHCGGDAAADAHALGSVGALQVARDLVQLGQAPALGERQQQVDAAQRLAEGALDAVAERFEPLAGQRRHDDPVGMGEAQILAALVVDRVALVEDEQPRALAGADLVEH